MQTPRQRHLRRRRPARTPLRRHERHQDRRPQSRTRRARLRRRADRSHRAGSSAGLRRASDRHHGPRAQTPSLCEGLRPQLHSVPDRPLPRRGGQRESHPQAVRRRRVFRARNRARMHRCREQYLHGCVCRETRGDSRRDRRGEVGHQ